MLRDIITEPSERPDTSMTQNVLTHRLHCLLFAKGLPPSDMGGDGATSVPQIIAHVLPNAAVFTNTTAAGVSAPGGRFCAIRVGLGFWNLRIDRGRHHGSLDLVEDRLCVDRWFSRV